MQTSIEKGPHPTVALPDDHELLVAHGIGQMVAGVRNRLGATRDLPDARPEAAILLFVTLLVEVAILRKPRFVGTEQQIFRVRQPLGPFDPPLRCVTVDDFDVSRLGHFEVPFPCVRLTAPGLEIEFRVRLPAREALVC